MGTLEKDALCKELALYLNDLILHDIDGLVHLLYRIDVNEKQLKTLLKEKVTEDAGLLLADLVLERQLQKLNARNQTPPPDNTIPDDERW